jgi:hypothetical protein
MEDIHIDRLTFNVSGITEAEGRELAEAVARELAAAGLNGIGGRSCSTVRVHAEHAAGGDIRALSRRIVGGVLDQLRRGT